MDKKKQETSRRQFFSRFLSTDAEKISLLTPDGKLVLVDKAVVQAASKNKKASNREIYDWMKNPSKDDR